MNRWRCSLALSVTLLMFWISAPFPAAQSQQRHTGSRLILFEEEKINPALEFEYERGVTGLAEAIRTSKANKEWSWESSSRHGTYYYVWPLRSVEVLDDKSEQAQHRQKMLWDEVGQATYEKWATIYRPAVRTTKTYVLERLDDLSYQPASSAVHDPKFVFIDIHRVRNDRLPQYKAVIARFVEAVRKSGYPIGWTAYRSIIGEARMYCYFSPLDSQSQFYEKFPFPTALEKSLGKDGAEQLEKDIRDCMETYEYFDARLRPEMSNLGHLGKAQSSEGGNRPQSLGTMY